MASAFRILLLASGLSFFTPAYGSLLFTLGTTDGSVRINGGNPINNTGFTVEALVTSTVLSTGIFGSDRYVVNQAWFTMPSANIVRVLVNTALFVEIGLPGAGVPTALVLGRNPPGEFMGVFDDPAISSWNRTSPLGPITQLASTGTGSLTLALANASVVTITSFDLAANNRNDATLQVAQVPEPASVGLVAFAGLAMAAWRARRGRRA